MASGASPTLVASSDDPRVDAFLRRFVRAAEAAAPGRVGGYYLIGSYADGSAVAVSDLDLVVLVRGRLDGATEGALWRCAESVAPGCPVRLDLTVSGEADASWEKEHVKLASRLVAGEDARDRLVLPPPTPRDAWEWMRYAQVHVAAGLRGTARLTLPLGYPDPGGECFGYDTNRYPEWYPPGTARGLRMLVNTACAIAKGLLPPDAAHRAGSKAQTIALYREHGGGAWAGYVDELHAQAKLRWGYLVPDAPAERRRLRALCRRMLGLERHFLVAYRGLLLRLLRGEDDEGRRFALARLGEVVYGDAEVRAACGEATAGASARATSEEARSGQDSSGF
jgi:hypothetical protein